MGSRQPVNLMLTLAYMLTSDAAWKNAQVRVLVTGRANADHAAAQKRLERIIGQSRVRAEAVLLAPLAGDLGDRIRQESAHADLVMVHALAGDDASMFVAANQPLLKGLGTALLVRPAPVFDDPYTVFPAGQDEPQSVEVSPRTLTLRAPPAPALAPVIERLEHRVREAHEALPAVGRPAIGRRGTLVFGRRRPRGPKTSARSSVGSPGGAVVSTPREDSSSGREIRYAAAILDRNQSFMASGLRGRDDGADLAWTRRQREGVTRLLQDLQSALQEVPVMVAVPTREEDWARSPNDDFAIRAKKFRTRLSMRWLRRPPPPRRVPARRVVLQHLGASLWTKLGESIEKEGIRRLDALNRSDGCRLTSIDVSAT